MDKIVYLYRVRQNKISQRENRDIYIMQEYFYTKFSTFIYHICLHKSVSFYSINLIFGEVAGVSRAYNWS